MKLQYTFTRKFFLGGFAPEPPQGALFSPDLAGGNPPCTPHMEECTFFQGVKSSWGINMAENKYL
jgi:hypothetical protein